MFVRQQLNTLHWRKALSLCPTQGVLLMPYMGKASSHSRKKWKLSCRLVFAKMAKEFSHVRVFFFGIVHKTIKAFPVHATRPIRGILVQLHSLTTECR
jgi:hypothetical protein